MAAFLAGFGVTISLIPRIITLAHRHEFLDHPDGGRRTHARAVPRLGGIAIFVGAIIASVVMFGAGSLAGEVFWRDGLGWGVLLGASVVFLTGLIDDLRGVAPRVKIVAQTAAALLVISAGLELDSIAISPGGAALHLGWIGTAIAIVWIVGMTNAFNLIDGADGLAGTFALLAITAIIVAEVLVRGVTVMVVSFSILGAVFAFLQYNRAPARIFLGDSGSMTLGFVLSVLVLRAATDLAGRTYFLVPLFALAFPLLDTTIAIARRWLRGHPLSRADGRHIHHQLLALGISTRGTVLLLASFFALLAVLGFITSFAPNRLTMAFLAGSLAVVFTTAIYGSRWLGYVEFAELGNSIGSVLRNARTVVREKLHSAEIARRISAAESFEEVCALLEESIDETRVLDIELIAAPQVSHGPRRRQISPPDQLPIRLEYPFLWETQSGIREVVLRLWAERPSRATHPSAERIVTRLGPALEEWFRLHHAELADRFGAEMRDADIRTPTSSLGEP